MNGGGGEAVKCFLGGLSYQSNEDSLRAYFQQFGEVRAASRQELSFFFRRGT